VVSTYPSEKYVFVSWNDDIPKIQYATILKMFQTTNQFNVWNSMGKSDGNFLEYLMGIS
jgi:ABC-type uncharacterized transport system auxiliary subunit